MLVYQTVTHIEIFHRISPDFTGVKRNPWKIKVDESDEGCNLYIYIYVMDSNGKIFELY